MREPQRKTKAKIIGIVKEHLRSNLKEYMTISIIFLIGITLGVIFINNVEISNGDKIQDYLNSFINAMKTDYQIDTANLLKETLISNLSFAFLLWFIGSTVIGMPLIYAFIGVRGFCLGYTISAIMATLDLGKGILFGIVTLLFQNIIFIPCILALAVSGIKLHKSIIKDKRRENIKIEILRHTIFSFLMAIGLTISALIEVYISSNLITSIIQYI